MISNVCIYCNSTNLISLDSYKFKWNVCINCGCAKSYKKDKLLLDFIKTPISKYLDYKGWKQTKNRVFSDEVVDDDKSKIYDYFVSESHISFCLDDAKDFDNSVIKKYDIDLEGKNILDISGGNGHFINYFKEKYNCNITLTEFNKKALDYAKTKLSLKTQYYDFSKDKITDFFQKEEFDIIFVRAAVMFMDDLSGVLKSFSEILNKNGVLIINYSVIPTFGTIFRTQYDEYNYLNLYSENFIENESKRADFEVISKQRNYDYSTYVNDLDRFPIERYLIRYYELKALRDYRFHGREIVSRDRRRYDFILKKNILAKDRIFETKNFIDEIIKKDILDEREFKILDRICKKIDVVGEVFSNYKEDLSSKVGLTVLDIEDKFNLVELLLNQSQIKNDLKFYNSALKLLDKIKNNISITKLDTIKKRFKYYDWK